ncbi:TetR/AcrR family transcriptional regulator [Brachybacterium sp. FME24]|uniref:TetR/AcrR family transcriptional regulator n=1 Tax=Brachybacterium sp. FME24 TaxID=2742605 RepID=UPI001868A3D9|nr:TetR/AcrR family transcriptional regulator [Brachybacterium sp. FME24]
MTAEATTTRTPATPRAEARERTMRRIVELGNAQLAECGPGALSVREIARGLGMVSSAVYRYVSCRDELLTLLIVDAYGDLADAVDEALAEAGQGPRDRFLALATAMTRWAIAHPERWTLLYGTPVRGYDAPAESTNVGGTRVIARLLAIAADAQGGTGKAGAAGVRPAVRVTPAVEALLERHLAEFAVDSDVDSSLRAVTVWSGLVGIISAHVFGQLGADAVAVGEQILEIQGELLADLLIGS